MLIGQSVILKSNDASYCKTCRVEFLEDGKFWLSFLYSSNALFADPADSYWGLENDNRWSRSWTVQDDVLHIEFSKSRKRNGNLVSEITEIYSINLGGGHKEYLTTTVWDKKSKDYISNKSAFSSEGIQYNLLEPTLTDNYIVSDCVKFLVEKKINTWQRKNQFEKTSDYLERVNEKNRLAKQSEYQAFIIDSLGSFYFNKHLDFSTTVLNDYDADNETFLLTNSPVGDIVVKVPITMAREFPGYFSQVKFEDPEFVINNDKFIFTKFKLVRPNRKSSGVEGVDYFIYQSDIAKDYTITNIQYEYAEVEIENLNTKGVKSLSQVKTRQLNIDNSSVNTNIPKRSKVPNRYALVIGNEDYSSFQRNLESEQNVDYASHDAEVFKKYCLNTLGVKEENMNFLINATAGSMNQKINKVLKLMEKLGPEGELVIYYAGHGFPDEQTKEPYLIPVDVSGTDLSYAVKLQDLYKKLGNTGAKTTVFLDACFTGSGRNSGLIAARGVRVKPKEEMLSGDVVVFSASSGEQSALPYHQEGHGLFTYYLLEKLQESEGDISYGDLADYINSKVSVTSINVNEKEQDPVVNTSEKVAGSWRNWTF